MKAIFGKIKEFFASIRRLLTPRQPFSWQTLIMLSVFSYLMAALASPLVREFLASCGWLFLIAGVGWVTIEHPVKLYNLNLGPWITGSLVSIFLFGNFWEEQPSLTIVSWPLISAAIASIPKFFDADLKFNNPSPPDRQFLVILILSNVIISCWLQFYFVIQNWSQQYPTLLSDNWRRSAFVVRFDFQPVNTPRGVSVLNQAVSLVQANVENQPWPQVERWLLQIKQEPESFSNTVIQQLAQAEAQAQGSPTRRSVKVLENFLWRVEPRISAGNPYKLDLLAIWQGPSFTNQGYYLSQSCQITQVEPKSVPRTTTAESPNAIRGKVTCELASGLTPGQPEPAPQ